MADNTRTITIPLRRGYAETPRYKRTRKAVRVLKEFVSKHMKSDSIKIGKHLNEELWANGIKNPPARVTVNASKDADGTVRVELVGHDYVDFKQQDKTQAPKNLREKLKSAVKDAKETKPAKEEAPKAESKPAAAAKEKPAEKKEAKTESKAKDAKPKVEAKAEAPKKEAEPKANTKSE